MNCSPAHVALVLFSMLLATHQSTSSTTQTHSGEVVVTRLTRILSLEPVEGVFAYARISPDGRILAYTSETTDPSGTLTRTIRVVDLTTKNELFSEPGLDPYWSPDGNRLIFESQATEPNVSVLDIRDMSLVRNLVPVELGDYYSWGRRDESDVVLTIEGRYFFLDGLSVREPFRTMPQCTGLGTGERPLLSKDGRRATVFVDGQLAVRNIDDCQDITRLHVTGGKADFSWDGRYIAYHAWKPTADGYEIQVVDLESRTMQRVADLPGSSLYPSWTSDGRLAFRYDGDEYRGFLTAENFLSNSKVTMALNPSSVPASRWSEVFVEDPISSASVQLVHVWATWCAHCPESFVELLKARRLVESAGLDVAISAAPEPGNDLGDVRTFIDRHDIQVPQIRIRPERFDSVPWAHNHVPMTLMFRNGQLEGHRLGDQQATELLEWVMGANVLEGEDRD